jgi:hypothetical protein
MYVFAIITAAGPIGYYLLKDLTSDEIAVTSLRLGRRIDGIYHTRTYLTGLC